MTLELALQNPDAPLSWSAANQAAVKWKSPIWVLRRDGKQVRRSTNHMSLHTQMDREARSLAIKDEVDVVTICHQVNGPVLRKIWTPAEAKEWRVDMARIMSHATGFDCDPNNYI